MLPDRAVIFYKSFKNISHLISDFRFFFELSEGKPVAAKIHDQDKKAKHLNVHCVLLINNGKMAEIHLPGKFYA